MLNVATLVSRGLPLNRFSDPSMKNFMASSSSSDYSRKDIQSVAEDRDSWRLKAELLTSDFTAVMKC